MIEAAIIGCGAGFDPGHRRALEISSHKVRVIGVADPDLNAAQLAAAMFGVEASGVFTDYHELFTRMRVDAAYVTVPDERQEAVVADAARAGIHVITVRPADTPAGFKGRTAEAIREGIVKVALLPRSIGESADLYAEGIARFVRYLEDGVGEYPGQEAMAPPLEPMAVEPAFVRPAVPMDLTVVAPHLQITINCGNLEDALALAGKVHLHCDVIEVGASLLLEEGLGALEAIKTRFPERLCLAATRIMDNGRAGADQAFRHGADIVTVLGQADDRTVTEVVESAREHGGMVMGSLINAPNPLWRARELEKLGVQIVCFHGVSPRAPMDDPAVAAIEEAREALRCQIAVAGDIRPEYLGDLVEAGADVIALGDTITESDDPSAVAEAWILRIQGVAPPVAQ